MGYSEYLRMLGGGGDFFSQLIAGMDARQKQKQREEEGITTINSFEGIERLNIPHKYDFIQVGGRYFSCFLNDTKTIYSKEGKFLFECTDFRYYKGGMFLVGKKAEVSIITKSGIASEFGYALYNEEHKLTEAIFKPYGMNENFNEFGFAVVGFFGIWSKKAVINKLGEIVFQADDSPYLHGVVCSVNRKYINLLTGHVICEGAYDSMSTDEFLFQKTDSNCVYQISKKTGDFIIHGVLPKPKEEPKPKPPVVKKVPDPKRRRNDVCHCGSGKKYKHCCIHKDL